jgi:hypothetical protein
MSDTPRTDAAAMPIDRLDTIASRPCNVVHEDVCQQLERELTEAKFDLQFRRDLYALQSKELAEARAAKRLLAHALELMWPFIEEDDHPNCNTPEFSAAIAKYKAALASVKGGSDE